MHASTLGMCIPITYTFIYFFVAFHIKSINIYAEAKRKKKKLKKEKKEVEDENI